MIASAVLLFGSAKWYLSRSQKGWQLHRTSARLTALYGAIALSSGMIWGTVEWGKPWDWGDVRLNTFAALTGLAFFLVSGHASQPDDESTRDVLASIGLFGFMLVPLTYIATRLWQVQHPGPVILTNSADSGLPKEMILIWMLGFASMTILLVGQISTSMRIEQVEETIGNMQCALDQKGGVM